MMKQSMIVLVTGAALTAAAGIAGAHPGHPPISPPTVTFAAASESVPFKLFRGTRMLVPVVVNGHATQAMLDTGASMTTLDRAFARSIGLPEGFKIDGKGAGGTVEAELLSGVNIGLGGTRLTGMSVGAMDLSSVSRSLGFPVTMVLGRDFFNSAVISIDWAASNLQIHSLSAFRPATDATALNLHRRGPFNTIPVSVGGAQPIEALFDLGNDGALSLPRSYWEKRPELDTLRWAEWRRGGVGGLKPARSVIVPQVTFGGRTFEGVPATLSEASNDDDPTQMANVGIQFLKQFRVDLDLGHDRVFLAPRNDEPGFEHDRSGARFDLAGDRLTAVFVSPGSPAARAGLKEGDEISSVDGIRVDGQFYERADWARGAAGRAVALQRSDGTIVKLTLADYY